jgi:hypothetical protein
MLLEPTGKIIARGTDPHVAHLISVAKIFIEYYCVEEVIVGACFMTRWKKPLRDRR